ncbi:MAG: hypothetical protein ABI912_02395 [Actinomycetota bacterium]
MLDRRDDVRRLASNVPVGEPPHQRRDRDLWTTGTHGGSEKIGTLT